MRHLKYLLLLAFIAVPVVYSQGQVAIGVQIGPNYGFYNPPPVCEFGYYPDYPFACAPYGYWGPQWFVDGFFIGAGPWYRWYYTHPGFYRAYRGDWDRRFGRDFHERAFRGGGFHDRGFRGGNFDRGFHGGNRDFHGNAFRSFRGDEGRSLRGGGGFHGEAHARGGNGGFHGGGGHGGGHGGGGGHGHDGGHGRG